MKIRKKRKTLITGMLLFAFHFVVMQNCYSQAVYNATTFQTSIKSNEMLGSSNGLGWPYFSPDSAPTLPDWMADSHIDWSACEPYYDDAGELIGYKNLEVSEADAKEIEGYAQSLLSVIPNLDGQNCVDPFTWTIIIIACILGAGILTWIAVDQLLQHKVKNLIDGGGGGGDFEPPPPPEDPKAPPTPGTVPLKNILQLRNIRGKYSEDTPSGTILPPRNRIMPKPDPDPDGGDKKKKHPCDPQTQFSMSSPMSFNSGGANDTNDYLAFTLLRGMGKEALDDEGNPYYYNEFEMPQLFVPSWTEDVQNFMNHPAPNYALINSYMFFRSNNNNTNIDGLWSVYQFTIGYYNGEPRIWGRTIIRTVETSYEFSHVPYEEAVPISLTNNIEFEDMNPITLTKMYHWIRGYWKLKIVNNTGSSLKLNFSSPEQNVETKEAGAWWVTPRDRNGNPEQPLGRLAYIGDSNLVNEMTIGGSSEILISLSDIPYMYSGEINRSLRIDFVKNQLPVGNIRASLHSDCRWTDFGKLTAVYDNTGCSATLSIPEIEGEEENHLPSTSGDKIVTGDAPEMVLTIG